jgi:hypothetical protein
MIAVLAFAATAAASGPLPTLSARQNAAVHAYSQHLSALKRRDHGATVERVFADALRIRELLGGRTPDEPSIEDMSESDYLDLQRRLPGIELNREEVILAEPDTGYFVALASTFGRPIDREFFRAYQTTIPDSVFPVYMSERGPFSACTGFGEQKLTGSYGTWTAFRRSHPHAYRTGVKRFLDEIEEDVLSTCACGDRESVIRELRDFVAMFPRSRVTTAVTSRLHELEAGTSPVRFHCSPG